MTRLAIITVEISHFEVPLYRLISTLENLSCKVFYLIKPEVTQSYCSDYKQKIDWGVDLLAGYDSCYCKDTSTLQKEIERWEADVSLFYGYGWKGAIQLALANWWKRKPQIHRGTMNYLPDPRRGVKSRLLQPGVKVILKLFHAHHYGGEVSKRVLSSAGIRKQDCFFVPFSVDSKHFITAQKELGNIEAGKKIRQELGWDRNNLVVLFIAQYSWVKGPDIAMEVFKLLHEANDRVRFLCVGSGQMIKFMTGFAEKHLPEQVVHFAGFVPSLQTVPYYLASDIVLCSSRYETWARMVNEAMLCGKPCVASTRVAATGGLILDSINGFVVKNLTPETFANKVLAYFNLPIEKKDTICQKARQQAMQFSYEANLGNVEKAVNQAIANAKPRRAA